MAPPSLQRNWQTRRELQNLGYSPPSSEDEFASQKDIISLDSSGRDPSRFAFRKKKAFEDEVEEEVFALNGGGLGKKKTLLRDEEMDVDGDEEVGAMKKRKERKRRSAKVEEKKGRFAKPAVAESEPQGEEEGEDDVEAQERSSEEDEEVGESWGKAYHLETAGHRDARLRAEKKKKGRKPQRRKKGKGKDSDEESEAEKEARYLEEVRRIQKERNAQLEEEDFAPLGTWEFGDEGEKVTEVPPELDRPSLVGRILKKSPLTLALVDDYQTKFLELEKLQAEIASNAAASSASETTALNPNTIAEVDRPSTGPDQIFHLHYQMLSSYLTTLTFYFYILSHPTIPKSHFLTLESKVLKRLLDFGKVLRTMEDLELIGDHDHLGLASDMFDMGEDMESLWARDGGSESEEEIDSDKPLWSKEEMEELGELDDGELLALLDESREDLELVDQRKEKKKDGAKVTAPTPKKKKGDSPTNSNSTKNATQTDPLYLDDEDLFSFVPPNRDPQTGESKAKKRKKNVGASSLDFTPNDFLEASPSSSTTASKRHTLRFHTSQIEAKSKKRKATFGGDDDLPAKKSKGERRAEELRKQKHGAAGVGADLDAEDFGADDLEIARQVREADELDMSMEAPEEGDGDGDVYGQVAAFKAQKKRESKRAYDAARQEEREELMDPSSVDGPRSASRQIMKNKGLTPHRSKVNRNPRVKKKMQYEKAKKKVASQKRVYKGGMGALRNEGYTGEKTGISKNLVKSVRL
ncbi:hypothetical protein BT69DRAFT_1292239 [Atractiella rhizophila]|nr:hypothetical protein BT69DRAFT_1292239 [Atractiella rhizophila]